MGLKITSTEEKPMLARKIIKADLAFPEKSTPSNNDVASMIASELKVDGKTVVVKHIYTSFGSSDAKVEALVYDNEESLKKYEPVTKAMKLKVEAAAKKAAEPAKEEPKAEEAKPAEAEKPAEEAKPEEKKEEAPAEEKKEGKTEEKKE